MSRRTASLALLALSIGGFGIGLTEFVIAGLLTEVADDLGVSISVAGHLVGGYALAVVPGALVLTPLLMKRPPKQALLVLLAFFIAGSLLSAWSPNYEIMFAGRVFAALAHGGYFGIGAVLAASLVPRQRQASAVAALFAGLTLANVLGVPAGSLIGQQFGWRTVFWVISAVGVVAFAGLVALIPRIEPEKDQLPVGQQFRALARPQVLASLLTTALVFGGMFGVFTYIEPLLREVSGFSAATVPGLQARVMRHAHGAATLASATNIAAFNLGNTVGVSIAGAAIAAGFGLRSPTLTGAALTVVGLILIVIARAAALRRVEA